MGRKRNNPMTKPLDTITKKSRTGTTVGTDNPDGHTDTIKSIKEIVDPQTPMGISQWREHGKKHGYWEFFEKEAVKVASDEAWKWFSLYIKIRHGWKCITCGMGKKTPPIPRKTKI
jgi:hypothetical protein